MKMSQFPFGSRIEKVIQTDKSPKKAFVLGVYAGAVHAKWVDKYGKVIINPIGIASEPEIFWSCIKNLKNRMRFLSAKIIIT
jgi:hypothetical protein